ncbi:MAG: 50S ribosomal protein L13 [Myxococcales bacterium]|nr:50S ribosomal protein L13 [Myxococcales bacterium]
MKTYSPKLSDISRQWHVVDADGKVLGRIATEIATILRGKNKPIYSPHMDTGDFVVVVNSDKVRLTGKKEDEKMYHHHTGWVGGIVSRSAKDMREKDSTAMVKLAVKGMLPRGPLGRTMLSKLKVYAGAEHPHDAQKPQPLELAG